MEGRSEGPRRLRRCAARVSVRNASMSRPCSSRVLVAVKMRSTKRLSSSLCVPKDVFLYMTACRMQRSPKLLVGPKPGTSTDVQRHFSHWRISRAMPAVFFSARRAVQLRYPRVSGIHLHHALASPRQTSSCPAPRFRSPRARLLFNQANVVNGYNDFTSREKRSCR
jgi:hypothetical protein